VDVGVSLRGWTSIVFQVKAAANVYVALTTERQNFTSESMYEVVFGIDGSTKTVIR